MKFGPSAVEQFIATFPEELQCLALQVIKEEHDRFEREDFTPKEKELFRIASELGELSRQTIDDVIAKCIARDLFDVKPPA